MWINSRYIYLPFHNYEIQRLITLSCTIKNYSKV